MIWPLTFARDDIVVRGDATTWAVLSSCDKCRYLLGRIWDPQLPCSGIPWVRGTTGPSSSRLG